MYYCTDCNIFVEDPKLKNFKVAGKTQKAALCPVCLKKLTESQPQFCKYCGRRLTGTERDAYCGEECRRLGRRFWTRELIRRKRLKDDPIARILRMLTSYNNEHKTKYSYGQFVSLILPHLEKGKGKAYGY